MRSRVMHSTFPRIGWITAGNPNHYDGSGLLLKELRARSRDGEEFDGPNAQSALDDFTEEYEEEYGEKLTESNAVKRNQGDLLADLLSDLAPEGVVFEIRWNGSNANYGYFHHDDPRFKQRGCYEDPTSPWVKETQT
jgi:hypothetical protein